MPPKGWRKDAQGNYPTTSYIKEQESITIQDLLFPKSVIIQLAKGVNSDDSRKILINKDVGLALQRSATVFVNHLLMFAREFAKNQDRKSCNINDIYDALDQIGLGGFKSLINNKMIEYQNTVELKKHLKAQDPDVADKTEHDHNEDDDNTEDEQDEQETQDMLKDKEKLETKKPKPNVEA